MSILGQTGDDCRTTMTKIKKEQGLLQEALRDLDIELRALRKSKKDLEQKLNLSSQKLNLLKEQEIKLRNLISLSMKKEAALLNRKNNLKDRLGEVTKRIEKVKTIERELGDL